MIHKELIILFNFPIKLSQIKFQLNEKVFNQLLLYKL